MPPPHSFAARIRCDPWRLLVLSVTVLLAGNGCTTTRAPAPPTHRVSTEFERRFGPYADRMIDVIDARWTQSIRYLAQQDEPLPPEGTVVEVTFVLDRSGSVRVTQVTGEKPAAALAVEAIAAAARDASGYGPWTSEMVAELGDDEELTFTFHY